MNEQQIAQRILRRIEEEYNKQIKPEDKITFEEFRITCLGHLDIASYSQQNLKYYKIGEAGILVCPRCKRNLDKNLLKKDERVEELEEEIEYKDKKIKKLKDNKPTISYNIITSRG